MNGESLNIKDDNLKKLKSVLPEVFSEDQLDWEKLKAHFGDNIAIANERYTLNWAGKSDAFKALQQPTTATIKPAPEESINFDTTGNVFIEGENLEVLKVLQKSYYGKVKCIIIDPPYNTGNDSFIYPDSFKENRADYDKRIGVKDEEGYLMKEGYFRKNSKDSGHFHSNWLSMMYPRLFLAKNLMRDDGVIFIHIDDNEVHNLRLVMNEIFGEENFVAQIVWQKKYAVANDDDGISATHDYILVFQKSSEFERKLLPRTAKQLNRYQNPDNDARGDWSSSEYVSSKSKTERPTLWYPIKHPKTNEDVWPDENAVWRYSKEKHEKMVSENRLYWGPDQSYKKPRLKRFLSEIQDGVVPSTWWPFEEVGHNDEGQKETAELMGKKIFSTPKPVRLIKKIVSIATEKDSDDLILDFFSGSGTTAHAVMELNKEEDGNRRFILAQLPEICDETSEAYQTGFKTIADISKERIRRVIQKIQKEKSEKPDLFENNNLDLGFKVFKLGSSNFKIWRGITFRKKGENLNLAAEPEGNYNSETEQENDLIEQLEMFTNPVKEGSEKDNMFYELLLKAGYQLTDKIALRQAQGASVKFYSVKDNELIIALDEMTPDVVEIITKSLPKPKKVITLDILFANNDQLKTNTVLQMKDAGIDFKTV